MNERFDNENKFNEENHCETGNDSAAETQSHTESQKEEADAVREKLLLHQIERQHKSMRKTMVIGLVCCGVLGGGLGFGGGWLAGSLSGNTTTLLQSNASKIEVQTVDAGTEMSVQQVAALNQPSVVEIQTEMVTNGSFLQQYVQTGAGSGIIISQDGYIVTNNHVIEDATSITVRTSDGTSYSAQLVGTDSRTDIAVLKIDATGLQPVTLGNSDNLNVGDTAIAIGNPLGELGGTVTNGIISALDRTIVLDNEEMTLLQTNAAINPGNSGGGLFNSRGELIGMVVAKSSGEDIEGLGFAIPSNLVSQVAQELINNGYVTGRPALGVTVVNITSSQLAMQYGVNSLGVYISEVSSGSAAEQAGLQVGDRIISVDDQVVESYTDLSSILDDHAVGDTIEILVGRNGTTVTVSLTLQEMTQTAQ